MRENGYACEGMRESRGRRIGFFLATLLVSALFAGTTASAASALSPSVATDPASGIGETSATLNGLVNPNGLETKTYFEYGTTKSYGSKTAEVNVGSGTTTIERAVPTIWLSPNTEYHFRIVGTNASGTSQGIDRTFITAGPPEVSTGSVKTDPSGKTATLQFTVDPNGQSTTYQVEYGTSSGSYTTTAPIPAASAGSSYESSLIEYKVEGLSPGTKYFWRPTVSNEGGEDFGEESNFLSSSAPRVTNLVASDVARFSATLNATIEPHELKTTYKFEYGLTTSYGSKTTLKEIGSGVEKLDVSETISKLSQNTLYHYRIRAENSAGTTLSEDHTFRTLTSVDLQVNSVSLKSGTVLEVFSANLSFSGEYLHSCEETEFKGEVSENPGALQSVGTAKVQNPGGERCAWHGFTDIEYSIPTEGLSIEYASDSVKEGIARLSPLVLNQTVYWAGTEAEKCKYNLVLTGTYKTGAALEMSLSGKTKPIEAGFWCAGAEDVSGTFTVTSGGVAVVAKP